MWNMAASTRSVPGQADDVRPVFFETSSYSDHTDCRLLVGQAVSSGSRRLKIRCHALQQFLVFLDAGARTSSFHSIHGDRTFWDSEAEPLYRRPNEYSSAAPNHPEGAQPHRGKLENVRASRDAALELCICEKRRTGNLTLMIERNDMNRNNLGLVMSGELVYRKRSD
jgi:hypothetical protein